MRRWWAAVRAAGRIAWRDAVRAKGRTTLVAVMIGLPILIGTGGAVLLQSMVATDARELSWQLGDDAQARIDGYTGAGVEQSPGGDGISVSDVGLAAEPPGVAEYEVALADVLPEGDVLIRTITGGGQLSTADRAPRQTLRIVERPADATVLDSLAPLVDGTRPAEAGEVALVERWAERLDVGIGDAVTVTPDGGEPVEAVVTGIVADGPPQYSVGALAAPGGVFEPPASLADEYTTGYGYRWYVTGPEPVTWEHVQAINALGSTVLSRAVVLDPPPNPLGGGPPPMDAGTISIAAVVAAIALLEAILLIGPAFAVGARRNERQLGLIGANGGERRTLRHVVLFGGVVTGIGASMIALVAGVGIAVVVRWVVGMRNEFVFPDLRIPPVIAAFVVLGTLIATAAAWVPARRASRIDVVAALSGRRREAAVKHRVTVFGVVLFAAGAVAAFVGATSAQLMLLVGGVLALEVGLIAASGGLITLAGLVAPRLGVAGRIAVRDAVRQRSRTAPAVAAVIAAIAGIVAGAVYTQSNEHHTIAKYGPLAGEGVVAVGLPGQGPPIPDPRSQNLSEEEQEAEEVAQRAESYDLAVETVRAKLPVTDVIQVSMAAPLWEPEGATMQQPSIYLDTPPENFCPLFNPDQLSAAEREAARTDPRCTGGNLNGRVAWRAPTSPSTVIVDDGTVMSALDLPSGDEAAAALHDGKVVVTSQYDLWPDGTAHLSLRTFDEATAEMSERNEVALPAVAVDLPSPQQYRMILPPGVLDELGLTTQVSGFVAPTSRMPTVAEEDAVQKVFDDAADGQPTSVYVERGPDGTQQELVLLLLVAAAAVVGLGATGISVALAAAESRPDLATLGAVGAAPGVRRRVAAAQAGVIAVIGSGVGALTGLVLGRVLVTAQRNMWSVVDFDWVVITPWAAVAAIAVGVPLLAMAGGYLLTRSRLPMVRRIAG